LKPNHDLVDRYCSLVVQEGLQSSCGNLKFHFSNLFGGINFEGKRMLGIGGGYGMHSYYAARMGAEEVVCLEPEVEGSNSGVKKTFEMLHANLPSLNVELESTTIQAYAHNGKKFDIILLNDSINHLDEAACVNLHEDENSRERYRRVFAKISDLSMSQAKLIICDCSRYNFFALLKVRNPFFPAIEWHKHQAPELWVDLLASVGFQNPRISWSTFKSLRLPGKLLFGNRLASFFLRSHFCLRMGKA